MYLIHCGVLLSFLMGSAYAAEPFIELMVENAAEPFSRADGSGYSNELIVAAYAAVGIEARLKVVPYARCKNMVLDARVVACFNMAWEGALNGKVRFPSIPLYTVTPVYFQNKQRPLSAKTEEELGPGVKIGVVNGYEYPPSASGLAKRGVVFVAGNSEQINLKQLAVGSLDSVLVMANEIQIPAYWAKSAGVAEQVETIFSSSKQDVFIGFSIQHPKGLWALGQFEQGYKIIADNGKLKQIKAKWGVLK
jgi:polar amino acid transport system substrate-binding protein